MEPLLGLTVFVKLKKIAQNCKLIGVVSMMLLSGCATNLTVDASVPKPLIEKLPISAKIHYSEAFSNYMFAESDRRRVLETVKFGQAQRKVFDQIFNSVLTVNKDDSATSQLTIEPEVIEFQYAVPAETKLSIYEVWLKYRIKVSDSQGSTLADWVVKGYGKTPSRALVSPSIMFDEVCNIALRDVGAQLALGFGQQSSIVDFINRSSSQPSKQSSKKTATEVQ